MTLRSLLLALLLTPLAAHATTLVPQPQSLVVSEGRLALAGSLALSVSDPTLAPERALAVAYLAEHQLVPGDGPALLLGLDSTLPASGYRLAVTGEGIALSGGDRAGVFYGLQSLRQLLAQAEGDNGQLALHRVTVTDAPRFGYRGLHLDVSRHFFDVAFIKRYLDLMALHKLNTFHWHLTDDQGWRLESLEFPRLTEVGAWREGTVRGHSHDAGAVSDGQRYGGYYTQDEVREVMAYAAARHITVVPEIDVPGHASAMLAAYPELGCTGRAPKVQTHFGVFPEILCPSEATFTFLDTLLAEVAGLFPGPYLHIGGDEARKDQWRDCADCDALMARENLADHAQLQAWFVNRVEKIVHGLGKRIIGWDEILDGDIRASATVMSWRGMEGGLRAARLGHDVIMTPLQHVYFDFYQGSAVDEPPAIHGLTRLRDVYAFEPVPEALEPEYRHHILGAQGNLWTEYVPDEAAAERMLLPRLAALAEVLWSPADQRRFSEFASRLPAFESQLRALGYRPADSHYKPHIAARRGAGDDYTVAIETLAPALRYTTDGSDPATHGEPYSGPFTVAGDAAIRAAAVQPDDSLLGDARLTLVAHRARFATLRKPGASEPWPEAAVLVDGQLATDRIFRYPEWLGFGPEGIAVEIVFDAPTEVASASVGVQAGYHRRLHRPTSLLLEGQLGDGSWQPLAALDAATITAAGKRLQLTFPATLVTALRLTGGNDQQAWSEEEGDYRAPTLRVDEIIVH